MARVAPSERFRSELDEVLAGIGREQDPVETIGRLGARLVFQQALEDEVSEFLGRGRYERTEEPVSHRNGYEPRTVKTMSGPLELERPRIRNAGELGFESRVLGKGVARTHALESLVICSFLRGLSTRDIEAAARSCRSCAASSARPDKRRLYEGVVRDGRYPVQPERAGRRAARRDRVGVEVELVDRRELPAGRAPERGQLKLGDPRERRLAARVEGRAGGGDLSQSSPPSAARSGGSSRPRTPSAAP
jgi:hypothetical protein